MPATRSSPWKESGVLKNLEFSIYDGVLSFGEHELLIKDPDRKWLVVVSPQGDPLTVRELP